MKTKFKIFRFDPERDKEPRFQYFTISVNQTDRILDCLNRIKWEQDGTLGFRMSCGHFDIFLTRAMKTILNV